jgi:N-acetylglucosamine-6-phosphate deacetylase
VPAVGGPLWGMKGVAIGSAEDGDRTIVKEDSRAYVEGGTLVGSVAPMNLCIANIVRSVGCSLAEAVNIASLNPAALIGVDDRKGSLEPGKDADLVVIDEEVKVYMTMVKGQTVYRTNRSFPSPTPLRFGDVSTSL